MNKKNFKTKTPIANKDQFNDYDILYDCKQTAHDLLVLYFYFMAEVSSEQNFNKIEEVAYELIEDYRQMLTLIQKLGWYHEDSIPNAEVVHLIHSLKLKRKSIEKKNNL